tara:strand:+ start:238 stop:489 length:252 start_codon:yes stop_codon:yes gene_type:complete
VEEEEELCFKEKNFDDKSREAQKPAPRGQNEARRRRRLLVVVVFGGLVLNAMEKEREDIDFHNTEERGKCGVFFLCFHPKSFC